MNAAQPALPLLDEEHADFIQRRVSISVASCSRECVPTLARGYGCRVAPDRRSVTVFLALPQSEPLLADLRAGGAIAVVFSRPTTHQTIQLKGTQARVVPLEDGDRALMRAYGQSFSGEVRAIGYRDPFASAIVSLVEEEAVGITFTPTAAFVQTPGPTAGQPLAMKP